LSESLAAKLREFGALLASGISVLSSAESTARAASFEFRGDVFGVLLVALKDFQPGRE
jgi:hypothetical protein